MVGFTSVLRFSLAVTATNPAAATFAPSEGDEDVSVGAVLSTLRMTTGAEVAELPALSVTTTRRS